MGKIRMKTNVRSHLTVIAIFLCAILGIVFAFNYMTTRATARMNALLEGIETGSPLSEAMNKLGEPSRVLTKPADVADWGTIKDESILEKCDLYMFPYIHLDMPHKYILVYVNKDSNEVYTVRVMSM